MSKVRKTIIGIIGPIGSGKDEAAEYIAKKLHVQNFQVSAPLKNIAHERGIEPSRENLVELGRIIAAELGADYLTRAVMKEVKDIAVLTGMRQLAQIQYLRKNTRLILLAIDAEPSIRFERSKERGKLGEATSLEIFTRNEQAENSAPHIQRLFECMRLADEHIQNNGDLQALYQNIDTVLAKYALSAGQ